MKEQKQKSEINMVQHLNLELIGEINFNNFEGARIKDMLIENKRLWRGVIADSDYYERCEKKRLISGCDLIKLRDIEENYWNVDTLYILSSGEDDEKLILLAHKMHPDNIEWIDEEKAGRMLGEIPPTARLLRLWWD